MERRRFAVAAAALVAAAGVLAGCGGASSSGASGAGKGNDASTHGSTSSGPSGTVTANYTSNPFTADFNEFSPGAQWMPLSMVYEPLMFFDTAKAGVVKPWLATSYKWADGGKQITFQLRHGVTWNDGKPFTSADVVYTFMLGHNDPALNSNGLPIVSATANGRYSVTLTFSRPEYTDLYYIAGKTLILPQHIWSKIPNARKAKWTDPHPVGTGAYMVTKVTPQVMVMTANPHYYQAGLPKVKQYEFLTYSSNQPADAAIENGTLDWSGGFIPDINKNYVDKSTTNHLVDLPLAVVYLTPNMGKGLSAQLPVRQAVSAAIDRNYISQTVYNGYAPPTDPEGLLVPNFDNIASAATKADSFGGADPAKSRQILTAAGYTMGGDGYFQAKGGGDLTIDVKVVSGWTDYASILQILGPELKKAGIKLKITQEQYSVWTNDQDTGNFQFLLTSAGYTPIPYAFYHNLLSSAITQPLGKAETTGNYGRYKNPRVDSLLNTIAGTTDTATQDQAFAQIESIFKQQVPDIPLFAAQDEIEFNGKKVTGFPTKADPYAGAATWLSPDDGWVADHLAPAK